MQAVLIKFGWNTGCKLAIWSLYPGFRQSQFLWMHSLFLNIHQILDPVAAVRPLPVQLAWTRAQQVQCPEADIKDWCLQRQPNKFSGSFDFKVCNKKIWKNIYFSSNWNAFNLPWKGSFFRFFPYFLLCLPSNSNPSAVLTSSQSLNTSLHLNIS